MTSNIVRYFEEMSVRLGVVDETKKEIDRLVAPDFNPFSILWPDEVRLSNMIASLLNPSASHGQGSKFLDAFLDMLEKKKDQIFAIDKIREFKDKWRGSKNIKSEIEQSTGMIEASQRRMDILVSGDGFGLMIENKPWALDLKDQLKNYHEELSRRFPEGRHVMIYLSGKGAPPSECSLTEKERHELEQRGELMVIAYRPHLVEWLVDCLALAEADRVRWLIKDFISYIEASIPYSNTKPSGGAMNLYTKEFIEHATINEQNMRVAIIAGLSFYELRYHLIRDFSSAMKKAFQVKGGVLDSRGWEESPVGRYTGIKFRQNHWPDDIFIRISGETDGLRDYIVGVDADIGKVRREDRDAITEKLNTSLSICKRPTDGWPWYRDVDIRYRNFDCEETLMALYLKEPMVSDLFRNIDDISKCLDLIFPKQA